MCCTATAVAVATVLATGTTTTAAANTAATTILIIIIITTTMVCSKMFNTVGTSLIRLPGTGANQPDPINVIMNLNGAVDLFPHLNIPTVPVARRLPTAPPSTTPLPIDTYTLTKEQRRKIVKELSVRDNFAAEYNVTVTAQELYEEILEEIKKNEGNIILFRNAIRKLLHAVKTWKVIAKYRKSESCADLNRFKAKIADIPMEDRSTESLVHEIKLLSKRNCWIELQYYVVTKIDLFRKVNNVLMDAKNEQDAMEEKVNGASYNFM